MFGGFREAQRCVSASLFEPHKRDHSRGIINVTEGFGGCKVSPGILYIIAELYSLLIYKVSPKSITILKASFVKSKYLRLLFLGQ